MQVVRHIRRFFEDKRFLEVETPILSDHSSGAMARPFTTESVALVCGLAFELDDFSSAFSSLAELCVLHVLSAAW